MKRTLVLLLFTIWICSANAQSSNPQITSSTGEAYQGNSLQVDWTLGEVAITTIMNSTHKITQGFHQPNYIITNVNELPQEFGKLKVYPNPTSDRIELELNFEKVKNVRIQLIDLSGRIIWIEENYGSQIKQMESITNLPNGTYFLNFIIDEKEYSQTYKIQKID